MSFTSIREFVLLALVAILFTGPACRHSPTAPSPPVTWMISPTSAVMRAGDTVAFRFTSSAPPENVPLCLISRLDIGEFHNRLVMDLPPFGGTLPTTGECVVTLVRVFQPGRVLLRVQENVGTLGAPRVRTNVEATIDVEL